VIALRSMIASDDVLSRDLGMEDTVAVVTRSGRKVHAAHAGSSVTHCGHWLRTQATGYRVRVGLVEQAGMPLCERCFRDATATGPQAHCPYCAPDEKCALHTDGVS